MRYVDGFIINDDSSDEETFSQHYYYVPGRNKSKTRKSRNIDSFLFRTFLMSRASLRMYYGYDRKGYSLYTGSSTCSPYRIG